MHEWVERNTILRGQVGSGIHGIAIEGTDDRDEMGITVEPPAYVIGLRHFEQQVFRTQPEGSRSGPGDLDRVTYSLRKWARLASKGNPSILVMLYLPREECQIRNRVGEDLQRRAHMFISRQAGKAYLGYLRAQRGRLTGDRGGKKVNRPELIEAYGFDTKYAGHIIRLGMQGVELLTTGRLSLPMRPGDREQILAIRTGKVLLTEVLAQATDLEHKLIALTDGLGSRLPPEPDYAGIDLWLEWAHSYAWSTFARS